MLPCETPWKFNIWLFLQLLFLTEILNDRMKQVKHILFWFESEVNLMLKPETETSALALPGTVAILHFITRGHNKPNPFS